MNGTSSSRQSRIARIVSFDVFFCYGLKKVIERIQRKTTLGVAKYALSQALGRFVVEEIATEVSLSFFRVEICPSSIPVSSLFSFHSRFFLSFSKSN